MWTALLKRLFDRPRTAPSPSQRATLAGFTLLEDRSVPSATCSSAVVDLIAGQNQDVGQVEIRGVNNDDDPYVDEVTVVYSLDSTNNYYFSEAHVHLATSVDQIPRTKNGNPIPGLFAYHSSDPGVVISADLKTITFTIDVNDRDWVCGQDVIVAAHASVYQQSAEGGIVNTETAWGAGTRFVQRGNWATYSAIQLCCDEDTGEGGESTTWE
jgi:hypothetical protein